MDAEAPRGLGLIGVGMERQHEIGLEAFNGDGLVVFDLETLGAPGLDGYDVSAEDGVAAGVVDAALALFKKAGVDGLRFQAGVDFLGALALEDDGGDADGTIPYGEVGDGGTAGQSEDVIPFLDVAGVVKED